MPMHYRKSAIPEALMATLMACGSPGEEIPGVPAGELVCGKSFYNPGSCEESIPKKMDPEVAKLLCDTAIAIEKKEKAYKISDNKGPSDLFHRRFPMVTRAIGSGNEVFQCGADPDTGNAACRKWGVKDEQGTVDSFELGKLKGSIEIQDGLAELVTTDPKSQLVAGVLDGITPVADDWNQPCENGEKTCYMDYPPQECKKPLADFVDKIRTGIKKIVEQEAGKKVNFAERRRRR